MADQDEPNKVFEKKIIHLSERLGKEFEQAEGKKFITTIKVRLFRTDTSATAYLQIIIKESLSFFNKVKIVKIEYVPDSVRPKLDVLFRSRVYFKTLMSLIKKYHKDLERLINQKIKLSVTQKTHDEVIEAENRIAFKLLSRFTKDLEIIIGQKLKISAKNKEFRTDTSSIVYHQMRIREKGWRGKDIVIFDMRRIKEGNINLDIFLKNQSYEKQITKLIYKQKPQIESKLKMKLVIDIKKKY